jgi:signal transduction histidine kinase
VEVRLEARGLEQAKKIPVDVRQNLYLIFKEAMNNVVRHSGARHAQINIANAAGKFSMVIEDDGEGIAQNGHLTGQGLRNMKLRAERIHADLMILSPPGMQIRLTMKEL